MQEQSMLYDKKIVDELIALDDSGKSLTKEEIAIVIDAASKEYVPAIKAYTCHNPKASINLMAELCKKPDVNAQILRMLGLVYLKGELIEKNIDLGLHYYQMAVDRDDKTAITNLACTYDFGNYGVPKDYTKALELYKKSIDLGSDECLVNLGWLIHRNDKKKERSQEVIALYRKSIERGNCLSYAYNCLGLCYNDGYGVDRDFDKAVEYFQEAIDNGNTDLAYANIVRAYDNVDNPKSSYTLALNYLKKGIEAGSQECQKLYDRYKARLAKQDKIPANILLFEDLLRKGKSAE